MRGRHNAGTLSIYLSIVSAALLKRFSSLTGMVFIILWITRRSFEVFHRCVEVLLGDILRKDSAIGFQRVFRFVKKAKSTGTVRAISQGILYSIFRSLRARLSDRITEER